MKKGVFRLNLILFMVLLLKKKIFFIKIKKSYNWFIIRTGSIYYFVKKKLVALVFLSNYTLKKYFLFTKDLNYFYTLKGICNSSFILNSKLAFLTEFFYKIKELGCIKRLDYLFNSQYFVSVTRSPFVYKKSMEQFFYKKYAINYQTNISRYNYFFNTYQVFNLKKVLQKENFLKLLCKITFYF
jgi:hypothetical protein